MQIMLLKQRYAKNSKTKRFILFNCELVKNGKKKFNMIRYNELYGVIVISP